MSLAILVEIRFGIHIYELYIAIDNAAVLCINCLYILYRSLLKMFLNSMGIFVMLAVRFC